MHLQAWFEAGVRVHYAHASMQTHADRCCRDLVWVTQIDNVEINPANQSQTACSFFALTTNMSQVQRHLSKAWLLFHPKADLLHT